MPAMQTETVIVGAGQAGLALSRHLTWLGRDHVVLERGRIGSRWHDERWDSMTLLSPNWLNRLPGAPEPADPDGFMTRTEFAELLERYADSFGAPVLDGTDVERVVPAGRGFRVHTSGGSWTAVNVVVAIGDCDVPRVPPQARHLPPGVTSLSVRDYKRPASVGDGGVLVVGSGPSGQQVARELRRAGREVVLAAGRHGRAPRRYRGLDFWTWMEAIGMLDVSIDDAPDPEAARRTPSIALSGACGGVDIDLGLLQAEGVQVTGRLLGLSGSKALLADDLAVTALDADERMFGVLAEIDAHIDRTGIDAPETPVATLALRAAPATIDLAQRGIRTVVWATGYGRDYRWLDVPGARSRDGELIQRRGATPVPGLYVLGLRFQYRRKSHFIGGVGRDAAEVARAISARRAVVGPRRGGREGGAGRRPTPPGTGYVFKAPLT
jgi:putative flavoprotein involved in K+ transport